jgi:hypothetical protein
MPRWLKAFSSPDEKEGFSVTAGIIVAGSSLSGGVGYRRLNVFKNIDYEVEGNLSVRGYQDYRAAIGCSTHGRPRSNSMSPIARSRRSSTRRHAIAWLRGLSRSALSRLPQAHLLRNWHRLSEEDRADYALHGMSVEGVWQWQLTPVAGCERTRRLARSRGRTGHNDALSMSKSDSFPR